MHEDAHLEAEYEDRNGGLIDGPEDDLDPEDLLEDDDEEYGP